MTSELRRLRRLGSQSRRGTAVILVLGLLAITLATTFALTRTQFRSFQIHSNQQRTGDARAAAMSGLSFGLRQIHQSGWSIGDTHTINVGPNEWFELSFSAGDPTLEATDSDYDMFPYRVTLTSVGKVQNPMLPSTPTQFTLVSVVELIPRSFTSSDPNWTNANAHTVRQWHTSSTSRFEIEPRFRIEGNVRVQGAMTVCAVSPLDTSTREQWLYDLRRNFANNGVDHRPFNGRIDIDYDNTSWSTRNLLWDELGLSVNDVNSSSKSYSHPGVVDSYRLYPGGPAYAVPKLGSWVGSVEMTPDPKTNPLGVVTSTGAVSLDDDTTIEGVVILGDSDLHIIGSNVVLQNVVLPPLEGAAAGLALPTVIAPDDFRIEPNTGGELHGLFAVWDDFELKYGDQDTIAFTWEGRLLCKELLIRSRTEWSNSDAWWEDRLTEFQAQEDDGEPLFSKWLTNIRGLPSQPILTVRPESGAVAYHWVDWSQPLFAVHPDDDGLRWRIVRWGENP